MASNSLENNKPNACTVRVGRASCWRVLCCRVVSVPCSLVVTSWERADLLAVMFVVFCHFPECVLVRIAVMGEVGGVRLGCKLLYVHSSVAIILMGKRELIALLNLSSWCPVMVERLFLAVPRGFLQFVIVVFPDHTHLLFWTL